MKKSLIVLMAVATLTGLMAVPVFAADKLVVKDATGTNTVFVVTDTGNVGVGAAIPNSQLHVISETASPTRGYISDQNTPDTAAPVMLFRKSRGSAASPTAVVQGDYIGTFHGEAHDGATYQIPASFTFYVDGPVTAGSTPTAFALITGSSVGNRTMRLVVNSAGNVGIGTTNPTHRLQVCDSTGTVCSYSDGGTNWTASSREYKQNIEELSSDKAFDTLNNLTPVTFAYKFLPNQGHVGFIAEDAPELIASNDRKALSSMDIVAVLTKVVQEQNKTIEALAAKIEKIEKAAQDSRASKVLE